MAVKKYNIRQGYQELQADLDKIEDMPSVEDVESGLSKANSAYQKPSSGIPASDLDPEAIPSVMPISTDISADGTSDTMAASPKAVKTYVDGHTPDNVLKYTQQTLTEEQKAQARANVDVASPADIAVIEAAIQAIDRGEYITETVRPTASASTMGPIYLIGPDANNNYERYITKESNGTYSWVSLGSTQIDLSTYAKNEKVSQLEAEVHNLSGKYYGVFADESDLPDDAVTPGYAFVGAENPYAIWNFDGEDWSDSGSVANGITGEPGVGFDSVSTPSTPDGTFEILLSNGNKIVVDMNHEHAAYVKYQLCADETEYQGITTKESNKLYLIPETSL